MYSVYKYLIRVCYFILQDKVLKNERVEKKENVTVRSHGYNTSVQRIRCNDKYANYKLGSLCSEQR